MLQPRMHICGTTQLFYVRIKNQSKSKALKLFLHISTPATTPLTLLMNCTESQNHYGESRESNNHSQNTKHITFKRTQPTHAQNSAKVTQTNLFPKTLYNYKCNLSHLQTFCGKISEFLITLKFFVTTVNVSDYIKNILCKNFKKCKVLEHNAYEVFLCSSEHFKICSQM